MNGSYCAKCLVAGVWTPADTICLGHAVCARHVFTLVPAWDPADDLPVGGKRDDAIEERLKTLIETRR